MFSKLKKEGINKNIKMKRELQWNFYSINSDKIKYGYIPEPNFTLTQRTDLTYSFEYYLDPNQNYSLTFNFVTGKI